MQGDVLVSVGKKHQSVEFFKLVNLSCRSFILCVLLKLFFIMSIRVRCTDWKSSKHKQSCLGEFLVLRLYVLFAGCWVWYEFTSCPLLTCVRNSSWVIKACPTDSVLWRCGSQLCLLPWRRLFSFWNNLNGQKTEYLGIKTCQMCYVIMFWAKGMFKVIFT